VDCGTEKLLDDRRKYTFRGKFTIPIGRGRSHHSESGNGMQVSGALQSSGVVLFQVSPSQFHRELSTVSASSFLDYDHQMVRTGSALYIGHLWADVISSIAMSSAADIDPEAQLERQYSISSRFTHPISFCFS